MVDQSELPFRMLCRKYGATAAYTPMLHSRLFVEDPKYRSNEFTTCPVSINMSTFGPNIIYRVFLVTSKVLTAFYVRAIDQ